MAPREFVAGSVRLSSARPPMLLGAFLAPRLAEAGTTEEERQRAEWLVAEGIKDADRDIMQQ
jgi:hypothetical protein